MFTRASCSFEETAPSLSELIGSFLTYLAMGAGGPWATACVVWFAGVASWNHYLFRPPRYHGSNN